MKFTNIFTNFIIVGILILTSIGLIFSQETERLLIQSNDPIEKTPTSERSSIIDNIIQIIENDTIRSYEVWKYDYETEDGAIKDPQVLLADIEYELFERIPAKYPNNLIKYEPFPNCTQIGVQGYHSNPVDKHYATYTVDSVEYVLCFYVLDWDPDLDEIELNFTVQVARFWH